MNRILSTPCPACRAQANEPCDADAAVLRTFVYDQRFDEAVWVCQDRAQATAYWPRATIIDDPPPSPEEGPEDARLRKAQADFLEKMLREGNVHVTPRAPDLISRLMADLAVQEAKAPWAGKAFVALRDSARKPPKEKP